MRKNKKQIRSEEYMQALVLINSKQESRICYALDRPYGSSKIGCPIIRYNLWPELQLFFFNDTHSFLTYHNEPDPDLNSSVRELILMFCIEMTRP